MLVKHRELTGKIIKRFYPVCDDLGYGFLEKVYENSLAIELRRGELAVVQQAPIKVYYAGVVAGMLRRSVGRGRCDRRAQGRAGIGKGARGAVAELSEGDTLSGGAAAQLWSQARDQAESV